MIDYDNFSTEKKEKLSRAVSFLFSPEQSQNSDFIKNIDQESLRSSYREKLRQYHPVVRLENAPGMIEKCTQRIIHLQNSYEFVRKHIRKSITDDFEVITSKRPYVIAVGGAKGGIGKSLITVNLGIALSNLGKKVVLVDCDFGGSNLHLFLNERSSAPRLNDFLNKKIFSLGDAITQTQFGPGLIACDSSRLGVTNINYFQKKKLLRAIKQLAADYVLIDLGGDTSYNTIDFFVSADRGIVLTTTEPAAYFDAYRFLKIAVHRKLERMFTKDSEYYKEKSEDIVVLIKSMINLKEDISKNKISDLILTVKLKQPKNLSVLLDVLASFRAAIIINKLPEGANAKKIVSQIQSASYKALTMDVPWLGDVSQSEEMDKSARDLVPVLSTHPDGISADELKVIAERLIDHTI